MSLTDNWLVEYITENTELVLSGHHASYAKDFRLLSPSHLTGAQFAGEETKVKGHSGWEPARS